MRQVLLINPYAPSAMPPNYHGQLWGIDDVNEEMSFMGSCVTPCLENYLKDNPGLRVVEELPNYRHH